MAVGECKHCGHSPVASSAAICPKCHGKHPVDEEMTLAFIGKALGFLLIVGIILYAFIN